MTFFQLIMLAAAGFFAYQVYMHIQSLDNEAEPEFMKRLEEIEPELTADELIERADQAYIDGQIDEAQRRLEEIVMLFPDFAEGMNKLAFVLAKQGDMSGAERYYKSSLEIKSDDVTHNALATVLVSLERVEEAEEHYKKALELDDNYEVTWFNYANLMQSLGKTEEARKMYMKALEIDPDFEQAKEELERLG